MQTHIQTVRKGVVERPAGVKKREVVSRDKFRAVFFTVDKFVTSCGAAFHDIISPSPQGWGEKEKMK